ncbi:MAG: AAA family ATPase [Thermoanaerobaculia bacterium]|nr:AAA family ATPase [Thermoanaerobaculia bacterium]
MGYLLEQFVQRHGSRLGNWKRRGPDGLRAACPAHADRHPSLDVDEKGGRLLFVCRAGCSDVFTVLREALGLEPDETSIDGRSTAWVTTARHRYGDLEHERRERYVRGERERQMPWNATADGGATWQPSTGGIASSAGLYQRSLLAERPTEPVFVVEGEKCADVLAAEGLVATTNPGGASEKNLGRYADAFRGRRVYILPDNDDAGERHAAEWVAALQGVARSAWIVRLPGLGPKDDVADWIARGGTADELERIAQDASPLAAIVAPTPSVRVIGEVLEILEHGWPKGWNLGLGEEVDSLVRFYPSHLAIVTGTPSSGKSSLVETIAVNVYREHGVKTAFFAGEAPEVEHVVYLAQKFHQASRETLRSQPNRRELVERIRNFAIRLEPAGGQRDVDTLVAAAEHAVERYGVRLIVLDPWSVIEKNRERWQTETEFVAVSLEKLRRLAQSTDTCVVLVAHPKKIARLADGNFELPSLYDISGSAHFFNAADLGLVVYRVRRDGRDFGELHVRKVRFGHMGSLGKAELVFNHATTAFLGADQAETMQRPLLREVPRD